MHRRWRKQHLLCALTVQVWNQTDYVGVGALHVRGLQFLWKAAGLVPAVSAPHLEPQGPTMANMGTSPLNLLQSRLSGVEGRRKQEGGWLGFGFCCVRAGR